MTRLFHILLSTNVQKVRPLAPTVSPEKSIFPAIDRYRRFTSSAAVCQEASLLDRLALLDTSSICDAAKAKGQPIGLITHKVRPLNRSLRVMAGRAFTVQCTAENDFLAVLQGLDQAVEGDVLIVNTKNSQKAVAGDLFATEAARKGIQGIVILDGAMRDTMHLSPTTTHPTAANDLIKNVRCYARRVTPYSGTIKVPGKLQEPVLCERDWTDDGSDNNVFTIDPGDVIVGDDDGIVVAKEETFHKLLKTAQQIAEIESKLRKAMVVDGTSLVSLTNLDTHVAALEGGKDSTLQFRLK